MVCNRLVLRLVAVAALLLVAMLVGLSLLLSDETLAGIVLIITGILGIGLCVSLYLRANRNLFVPLGHLRDWTYSMRAGQLSSRVPLPPGGELRRLSEDINALGETIQSLSRDMEAKVDEQTRYIARKNITLQILYDVASSVSVTQDLQELLSRSLHALQGVLDARAATIRLFDVDSGFKLATSCGFRAQDSDYDRLKTAELELCEMARENRTICEMANVIDTTQLTGPTFRGIKRLGLVSIPLTYHGRTLGIYSLFTDSASGSTQGELRELLINIGQHLGMAIQKARLDEEARRVSVVDERNRLAHELHDSLAQSLASLRFQVRVLDDTLHSGVESAVWHELERIENSLDEAYQELRDLIAHCRIRSDGDDLVHNIKNLINRYRSETDIHYLLQIEWGDLSLPSDSEIQILRIIQEALRNIYKHSEAKTVRILLSHPTADAYQVLIEDDGVGFSEEPATAAAGEHVGLKIMQERARRFAGQLEIESEPGEGTRVILTFTLKTPEKETPTALGWLK